MRNPGDLYAPMSDDDEVHLPVTYASHFNMDAACPYARGHRTRTRKRTDWRHHHARN